MTSSVVNINNGGTSMRGRAVHRRRGGSGDEDNDGSLRDDSESGQQSASNGAGTGNNNSTHHHRQQQQQQQQQHNSLFKRSSLLFRGFVEFLGGKQRSSRSPQHQRQQASHSRRSNICVLASFLVWLCVVFIIPQKAQQPPPLNMNTMALMHNSNIVSEADNVQQSTNFNQPHNQATGSVSSFNNLPIRERIQQRTQMRHSNNAGTGTGGGVSKFLKDAASGFYNVVDRATGTTSIVQRPPPPPPPQRGSRRGGAGGRGKDKESDLPGCTRPRWQQYNFVNCNDIHEVDLATIHKRKVGLEGPAPTSRVGYIGSGLWRSVHAVDPRQAVMPNQSVVIKIMKDEHDVNTRNFERHRRDALTMERLASSPHIVDIYAFCGNTVLTEFTSNSLDRVIYKDDENSEDRGGGNGDETLSAETTSTQTAAALHPTRRTAHGRLQLFLDVARGLQAIHDIKGGPIVHADLQAKQFLINTNGVVKINDFNRCRFMASNTGVPCKFRIPSAPGKYRSPEEYSDTWLDEKLDIYATASVFYGIMTGEKAWLDLSTGDTKKYVKKGVKPKIGDELRMPGSIDAALTNLTELAYTKNPEERISAAQLVAALEELQAKHPIR